MKNRRSNFKSNMKDIEYSIFGDNTRNFTTLDFANWRKNAIDNLRNIQKGFAYDERVINDLINYLDYVNIIDEDEFIIRDKVINTAELETLYNYIYMKDRPFAFSIKEFSISSAEKKEKLLDFYDDIVKNNIVVAIFETKREVLEYLFVGGNDNEEIVDNIEFLVKQIESNEKYDWEKANNVLFMNGRYFVLQW